MAMTETEELFERLTNSYVEIMRRFNESVYKACTGADSGEELYKTIIQQAKDVTEACWMIVLGEAQSPEFQAMMKQWRDTIDQTEPERFNQ